MKRITLFVCFIILAAVSASFANQKVSYNDLYVQGYVEAMLKEKYGLVMDVQVRGGDVYLPDSIATNDNYEAIIESISAEKKVKSIKLVSANQIRRMDRAWKLPEDSLFKPLIADPKWPCFSLGHAYFTTDKGFRNVINPTLGRTFPLYRTGLGEDIYLEFGVQASANMMFDTKSINLDLISADYMFGIPVTFQLDSLTVITRIYHQTSTTGSGYSNKSGKSTLGFKSLNSLASFEPTDWFRVYGGGEYVLLSSPSTYGKWMYQLGAELRVVADSPYIPVIVFAIDVKGYEDSRYIPSKNFRVGVELNEKTLIAFEVFDGYMQTGTYYKDRVTSVGASIRIY